MLQLLLACPSAALPTGSSRLPRRGLITGRRAAAQHVGRRLGSWAAAVRRLGLAKAPGRPLISHSQPQRRAPSPTRASSSSSSSSSPLLFPAGKRQAKVTIPALFVTVSADDVLGTAKTLDELGAAVAGGATAVVLRESAGGGASELYEASLAVREMLRGRAALLIQDRTDIAPAAEADGALLTPQGLPTVVAKRNMGDGLLLVGRLVESTAAAVTAARDGANYVVLQTPGGGAPSVDDALAAQQQQLSSGSIPVLAAVTEADSPADIEALAAAGVDGFSAPLQLLQPLAAAITDEWPSGTAAAAATVLMALSGDSGAGAASGGAAAAAAAAEPAAAAAAAAAPPLPSTLQLSQLLSSSREDMVAAEKRFLEEVLGFLEQHCPQLEEASLLGDALKALDELFLVVVVGEFNSGKSAVINALLGQRYLAEGILPTTNEINILKWADPARGGERTEQGADGLYTRYLPAELLRELNVVDTPGTNVILERQQRLTEEYVPRADLVLFVMSADRPFTESEVRFLKYVRRWGKKVVFVVNKVDILSSTGEVSEVVEFVRANATRLLGVESPRVLPVSSRSALEAKLAAQAEGGVSAGMLSPAELARLAVDSRWQSSRFESLERFIFDFLVGGGMPAEAAGSSGSGVAESVRLKLQTPLAITQALLEAAGVQLQQELEVARQEEASVGLVRQQLADFRAGMVRDAKLQRQEVARLVAATTKKAAAIVDDTLQLSNVDVLTAYLFGKSEPGKAMPVAKRFQSEVADNAATPLREVVREHSLWLAANCSKQVEGYRAFADRRAAALGTSLDALGGVELPGLESDAEARRRWRQMRQLAAESAAAGGDSQAIAAAGEESLAAVAALDPRTTEVLLEEEVREAVLSTAGTAAGAGAFGVLLTAVLPTTLEDLLALGLASMVGYVSILNLPLRRAEAKRKLETLATSFAQDIQERMERELGHALDMCEAEVMGFIEPLEQLTREGVEAAEAAEERRAALEGGLQALQRRVANLD